MTPKAVRGYDYRAVKLVMRAVLVTAFGGFIAVKLYDVLAQHYTFRWGLVWHQLPAFNEGLIITLEASGIGMLLGVVLGLIVALMRLSPFALFRDMGTLYVQTLRNIPSLIFIIFMYFGISRALLPRGANVGFMDNRLFWGSLALGLFEASFISEIFRAGIQSISKTQMEASRSMGMSYWQAMRYVILPQAFRIITPPMTGELIALVKESALLLVISLPELTWTAKDLGHQRPLQFEFYTILAAYYLAITVPISIISHLLEHRFNVHRRRA